MSTFSLSPAIADLDIPRWWPCSAKTMLKRECGATPTAEYRRVCAVEGHAKNIWLCPIHAMIVICNAAICRECEDRGGVSIVRVYRINIEPFRLA